jgi:hypothetical protein
LKDCALASIAKEPHPIFFGIEDKRRARDLLRDAVAKIEFEHFRNDRMRRGLTHDEPGLFSAPFGVRRTIQALCDLVIEFGSFFLVDGSNKASR